MVNDSLAVELARQARGGVAILHAEFAAGAVTIGVDGGLRHAQFAGDLLRRQMLIHQTQAFTLARCEQPDRIVSDIVASAHDVRVNDDLGPTSTLTRGAGYDQLHCDASEASEASMDIRDPTRTTQMELMIGARLRTRRRQLGLSQSDLAERLGVSFQQVQKYERGANRIAASTLLAAAQTLEASVGWLVGEETSGRNDEDDIFRALSRPGALEILEAFNAIPDVRLRAALLALAREMAASGAA
jgi:transcriptional regulator with XRE-family HTH domain